MNRRDYQRAFGDASEDFRLRLHQTLDGLEERNMKRRYRFSTVLVAAVILTAILAGAGIAASQLGIFDFLNTANPIVPLPGAEEMVMTHIGDAENDLVKLEIEEAVYDGQGALIQLRYTPKDAEKYALLHGAMDWVNDAYIYRHEQYEDGSGMYELVGRKDGRTIIHVGESISITGADGNEIEIDSWDGWEEEDGSVVVQGSGFAETALAKQVTLTVAARSFIETEGERDMHELAPVSVELMLSEEARQVQLLPVGETKLERFEFLSGDISLTRVRGYMNICYAYQPVREEAMGVTIKLYDGEGNEINAGSGGAAVAEMRDGWEITHEYCEMQSYEELPETIFVEAKVIGEDRTLGRIECRVVE